jgi:hypothetical protein
LSIEKKLREAHFFLKKMIEHERLAFDDKEPFDFYLSAFLNAGRTVGYRLRHEQGEEFLRWREGREATLQAQQQGLIKFMVNDRDVEVHGRGSSREVKTENRELEPGVHKLASGTNEIFGLPGWSATIQTPAYYFTIDGIERKVTEAGGEYLELLQPNGGEVQS